MFVLKIQLIAAGVLEKSDYPGFDEETGILPADDEAGSDEDIEIDIVEDEPLFLRGQTKISIQHSPVKIVKVHVIMVMGGFSFLGQCPFTAFSDPFVPTRTIVWIGMGYPNSMLITHLYFFQESRWQSPKSCPDPECSCQGEAGAETGPARGRDGQCTTGHRKNMDRSCSGGRGRYRW